MYQSSSFSSSSSSSSSSSFSSSSSMCSNSTQHERSEFAQLLQVFTLVKQRDFIRERIRRFSHHFSVFTRSFFLPRLGRKRRSRGEFHRVFRARTIFSDASQTKVLNFPSESITQISRGKNTCPSSRRRNASHHLEEDGTVENSPTLSPILILARVAFM